MEALVSLGYGTWPGGRFFDRETRTAVLFDECQCLVDSPINGCAANHATLFLLVYQSRRHEPTQMEGQGRGRHAETGLQLADRQSLRAGLDENSDDLEPGRVAEFGEASGCGIDVHVACINDLSARYNYKTGFMEILEIPASGKRTSET